MAISRPWHSEMYPRAWGSFLKQCQSPLDLRQYSLSVSPSGVVSIGTNIQKRSRNARPRQEQDQVVGGQRVDMVIGIALREKRQLFGGQRVKLSHFLWLLQLT